MARFGPFFAICTQEPVDFRFAFACTHVADALQKQKDRLVRRSF
jgi:hypothetical protein